MGLVVRLPGMIVLVSAGVFAAGNPEYDRARELYRQTEYQQSLATLQQITPKDAAVLKLTGENYFRLGEHEKALEAFDQALAIAPTKPMRSSLYHWLGRTHGRRAETGNFFAAPGRASQARANFEEALRVDPTNLEAANDLLDFYLQAPGFLGGSIEKADALAQRIGQLDAAEGHFAQAQLADKRKQFDRAEQEFRSAAELEPSDAGRWLDVAKYLARRGRLQESDAFFDRAAAIAPNQPQLLFDRAETYVRNRYRLDDARMLLDRYLQMPLTPDDPPRQRARALLERLGGRRRVE
jgi:tetratricopeptide (TPR) repeat protein